MHKSYFIIKDQILKLYKDIFTGALNDLVAKVKQTQEALSKADTRVKKGVILASLNKHPMLRALLKKGASLDAELETLKQRYNNEPLRLLDAQILEANKFLLSLDVQGAVALDFNLANYHSFDVNNGDNNCQSRIFLMELFQQGVLYEAKTKKSIPLFSKISLAFFLQGMAFVVLYAITSPSTLVSANMIGLSFGIIAFSELFIGPAVFSHCSKYSPKHMKGVLMGTVMLGFSLANVISGFLSKYMAIDESNSELGVSVYSDGFMKILIVCFAASCILWILRRKNV